MEHIAVICRSKEEETQLLTFWESLGLVWGSGVKPTSLSYFPNSRNWRYYRINERGDIVTGTMKSFLDERGITLVDFADYIASPLDEDASSDPNEFF